MSLFANRPVFNPKGTSLEVVTELPTNPKDKQVVIDMSSGTPITRVYDETSGQWKEQTASAPVGNASSVTFDKTGTSLASTNVQDGLKELDAKNKSQDNTITAIETNIGDIESDITDINTKVDNVESSITTMTANDLLQDLAISDVSTKIDDIEDAIDGLDYTKVESSTNGKLKIDGVEVEVYKHPDKHVPSDIATDANNRFVSDTQIANWNDKYTKTEVDTKLGDIIAGLDWKETVDTFADLSTTYNDAEEGWTASVKADDLIYRYNGTDWVAISSSDSATIPLATQTLDGKMSKEDKTKLDQISEGATKVEDSTTNGNIKIDGTEVEVYKHPTTHSATEITQDATHKFVTDAQITDWDSKADGIHNHSLSDLDDVDDTNKANGKVLKWNATTSKHEYVTMPSGSGGSEVEYKNYTDTFTYTDENLTKIERLYADSSTETMEYAYVDGNISTETITKDGKIITNTFTYDANGEIKNITTVITDVV